MRVWVNTASGWVPHGGVRTSGKRAAWVARLLARRLGWDTAAGSAAPAQRPAPPGAPTAAEAAISPAVFPNARAAAAEWSDAELRGAVRAYLDMLAAEQSSQDYTKAAVNRQLRAVHLSARSKGSVEYRMGNISAVMIDLGHPWIEGYKPAKNVGNKVKERIRTALAEFGLSAAPIEPTVPGERLERQVRRLRRNAKLSKPTGIKKPVPVTVSQTEFLRDPAVKAWVLEQACGVCEACAAPAPFATPDDEPFLEVHHVRPLGEGASDTVTNAVAVCPNCHRRFHHSRDRLVFTEALLLRVDRLVRELQSVRPRTN